MVEFIEGTKPTNEKHIANLLKLADFLESANIPPPRFHMNNFAIHLEVDKNPKELTYEDVNYYIVEIGSYTTYDPIEINEEVNNCGTVCCALGHGPLAGIKPSNDWFDWWNYAEEEFGIFSMSPSWYWLFVGDWYRVDNTPQGAAKRIRIYVENGVPYNHYEQRHGEDELMYKE